MVEWSVPKHLRNVTSSQSKSIHLILIHGWTALMMLWCPAFIAKIKNLRSLLWCCNMLCRILDFKLKTWHTSCQDQWPRYYIYWIVVGNIAFSFQICAILFSLPVFALSWPHDPTQSVLAEMVINLFLPLNLCTRSGETMSKWSPLFTQLFTSTVHLLKVTQGFDCLLERKLHSLGTGLYLFFPMT